ncbi:MAG: FAD-binding oxidoreductase [Emcibacter sp.]|nr:FAD-binding oxidoreductase [Emcibacter sp.]
MNSNQKTADFIIIGGGIAGAAAGYELSKIGKVIILEKENLPGYHSTSRSSAIFQKSYHHGDPLLNILVCASEDFLMNPPDDFTSYPLLSPRPLMYIVPNGKRSKLEALQKDLIKINIDSHYIDHAEVKKLLPILDQNYQDNVLLEQDAADIDVNALHQGYLNHIKAHDGEIITNAEVMDLKRLRNQWHLKTKVGEFIAPIVVNAAGAWVDEVARHANITPINIEPLRRTVIMVTLPKTLCPDHWPLVMDIDKGYYFKPDSGKILMTPGDSHLSPPLDAQPEEIDIAYGAHYLENATTLTVDKINHSWAGLRNYVKDGYPVVGFDPEQDGFFWLAGQGGFGIKTAPAMGRISAALIKDGKLPQDILGLGLTEDQISINRLKPKVPAYKTTS